MHMLLGNKEIQNYFKTLIENNNLSHAYLFYGPEGVGKKSFARSVSEKLTGSLSNQDLKIIDKEGDEISIVDIRELKNFIHLTPFGKCKTVIINNAHNLGRDASNALLKILEEPPGESVLFLISHLPKILLPTVLSRCQMVRFQPLKGKEIIDYLTGENKVKNETAVTIAKFANGSLGQALELVQNFDNFKKNITLLNKLAKAEFSERFEIAKKISAEDDFKKVVADWFFYSASLPDKKIASLLLNLSNMLSHSQFNRKLALENFLIKF